MKIEIKNRYVSIITFISLAMVWIFATIGFITVSNWLIKLIK